ncbi:MAG: hypothetical protein R6U95_05860 [Bacteroidales bacterium]
MQHYIEHLIDDIRNATWNLKPTHEVWKDLPQKPDNEVELNILNIEKYVHGEEESIEKITGIEHVQLPPPKKLNQEQQTLLATELENLLQYYHFCLDFPEMYPTHLRYPFIYKLWAESHVAVSVGYVHIEFCDYDDAHCPFPGYCTNCEDFRKEAEDKKYTDFHDLLDKSIEHMLLSKSEIEEWLHNRDDFFEDEFKIDKIASRNETEHIFSNGGLFDDNGKPINTDLIPIPGLCTICKHYDEEDFEENMLCDLNRFDQTNNTHFECVRFRKK